MRRWSLVGALVVLGLGAWFVVRPFMARQRDYPAEVPSPAALQTIGHVPLVSGRPVCFRYAVAEAHSQQARFVIGAPAGAHAGRLRLSLAATDGSGYRYAATYPAGAVNSQTILVPVTPPARPTPVRACIANYGSTPLQLYASGDRTQSRSTAFVGGRSTKESVWFSFYEAAPKSITQRVPLTIRRMTVFRPGYVGRGLLWVLFVLMLLGVPAGLAWVLGRAFAHDQAAAPARDPAERRPLWRRWLE